MNSRSIEMRLTIWYTALVVAASVAFGTYTYLSFEQRLNEEIQGMLARRLHHMQEDVLPDMPTSPDALARKIEDIYSPEANERFIRISKPDGGILYISGPPREKSFDPAQIPLPRDYGDKAEEHMPSLRRDADLLLIGVRSHVGDGDYIFEMGTSTIPVDSALRKLVATLLIGLPVVGLIAVAGGFFLIRRSLQPVEDMRAGAEQISFGNLRQRLPVTQTGDPIEHLSRTLNQMLDRLDRAYQQASRFSADASHELRTPLTIMRSELESLLQEPSLTPDLRDKTGSILEEAERLSSIVESLFSLARLDAGEAKAKNEIFDLAELVRLTLEQMQLLAEEKNISVAVNAQQPVSVMGDAARLKQVVVNLIGNAVKYTMSGGSIAIDVRAEGDKAVFSVKDNGTGIPSEALPHIFERFYRADKTRSRAVDGAGLGLSIAYAICQAHGGDIAAVSEEGVGTTITVTLPHIADLEGRS